MGWRWLLGIIGCALLCHLGRRPAACGLASGLMQPVGFARRPAPAKKIRQHGADVPHLAAFEGGGARMAPRRGNRRKPACKNPRMPALHIYRELTRFSAG